MIIEKAYAKLNLALSILGKRTDGFHELESIMVPIVDLYDELMFEENETDEFIILDSSIENNSILKAATAFQNKYHTKGAKIRLIKRIPLEAGLAGGSADSSATLRGLNRLFNLNIPLNELEELALSLGSDNVFCLYNKAAICRGRGEKLTFIDNDFEFKITLIRPSFGLLTRDVFANLELDDCQKYNRTLILKALKENNRELLIENIYNDLLKPAIKVDKRIKNIIDLVEKTGNKCFMSGSGSALFVIGNLDIKLTEYVCFGKHLVKNNVND